MIKLEDIKAKQEEMDKIQKELQGMIETYEIQKQDTYRLKFPDVGDTMYFVRMDGTCEEHKVTGHDVGLIVQGHAFLEMKEAVLESKRRNLLTRFRQFRDKCNGDWKPDFNNKDTKEYYIYYNYSNECLDVVHWTRIQDFVLFGYFEKKVDAQRAIKLFGDEIKELFVDEVL